MHDNFKIISVVVFIAFAVLGIMVFAGVIPIGKEKVNTDLTGTVYMWGTENAGPINAYLDRFNQINQTFKVIYQQKDKETIDQELLEALAEKNGPDMFLLTDDLTHKYGDKMYTIPYTTYPLLNFKNDYISASEVFLNSKGALAFPVSVDSLVMFYNRNILDANGIVYPPKTWEEFNQAVAKITKKDDANQIQKTAVALGQFSNVKNAKDIVVSLFMQLGNPIIKTEGGFPSSAFLDGQNPDSLGAALAFYTSFADPLKASYSWNKTFPNSQDAFSSDSLAFYFGFASELPVLINKNPNQSLGVAEIPQLKNSKIRATRGRVTGIAISSATKNFKTAYGASSMLANGSFAEEFVKSLGVAPARRNLLSKKQDGLFAPVFYSSALTARSWPDPSPKETDKIFRNMIESILSNSVKPKNAITDAGERINFLLSN